MNIQNDLLTRRLYAQDASMYEELPDGVAFPTDVKDIIKLVKQAKKKKLTITPRSAGTSLAGQATGNGIIMDVSRYMTDITEINETEHYAVVEPGVIRDTLNREVEELELLFGPDTSTTNRCMIGGMIGNNSSGSFSIRYKTTREHVKEMDVVLSDGSTATFKELTDEELEAKLEQKDLEGYIYRNMLELLEKNKYEILEEYPHPDIIRRNTGYALDKLCEMRPIKPEGKPFNMCELLCGSEGTLAITTSAKVNLEKKPKYKRMLIPHFQQLNQAMEATVHAVRFNPSAVELVDYVILDATKQNLEQSKNRFFLQRDPDFILIIQLEGDDEDKLKSDSDLLVKRLQQNKLGYAYVEITEDEEMDKVWALRKAGLGLLMGLGKESRTPAFCEDTSVRVQDLPRYVKDFQKILDKHDTSCVFYAHASVGELHFRPLIDTTSLEGITKMKQMAEEIAKLVGSYKGSLSGEHGDGRARAPFIKHVLGKDMLHLLKEVKEIWDPEYIFNPGKIVEPEPMEEDLRYSPKYYSPEQETVFQWRKEGSFNEALEMCNGAGVCRKLAESGGTMCPSYMATKDEVDSTRGRANVFRQVFSGADPEAFDSKDLKDALELCLSCKACMSECPANVDMAKMKAEFMNGWHEIYGVSEREQMFADPLKMYALAAKTPGLANFFLTSFPGKMYLKWKYGISPLRDLPPFAKTTFTKWFKKRPKNHQQLKVLLMVDVFNNYHEPEVPKAAVKVLESMGYEVIVPSIHELGRTYLSKGMLNEAKDIAVNVVNGLHPFASKNYPVIGLEPSEILTIRDEFLDLVEDGLLDKAKTLASKTFTFEEFVSRHKRQLPEPISERKVVLHGHCHAKSLVGNGPTEIALESAGYEVETLDTGCCGMAGSFGYEEEHYQVSMEIGWQRLFPQLGNLEENSNICAPGFSCRHQIKDGTGMQAQHPAILIARNIK